MLTKETIVEKAASLGFEDVGFTTAHPFDEHREFLEQRQAEYGWAERAGLKLLEGTDPKSVLPEAQTIIVLLEVYFKKAFPRSMEAHFGRCYLDDDRVTKDGLSRRIKAFRGFLRDHGINSKVPYNLPTGCQQPGRAWAHSAKTAFFIQTGQPVRVLGICPLPWSLTGNFPRGIRP